MIRFNQSILTIREILTNQTEIRSNKPKSDSIYHFPIYFEPNWRPFGSKSIGNQSLSSGINKNKDIWSRYSTFMFRSYWSLLWRLSSHSYLNFVPVVVVVLAQVFCRLSLRNLKNAAVNKSDNYSCSFSHFSHSSNKQITLPLPAVWQGFVLLASVLWCAK